MGVKQRKDTGRWQVDVRGSYVGIYPDEATARMMYQAGMRQVELGKPLPAVIRELRGESSSPTLSDYAAGWLPTCTTRDHAEAMYRHRLAWERMEPYIGRRTLDTLTADDVRRTVDRLAATYAPKTVRSTIATLRMMLADAHAAGIAKRNAAGHIRNLPDAPARTQRAISREAFWRLLQGANGCAPMIALLGLTGPRIGEMLGAKWSDIEWGAITYGRQVQAASRKVTATKRDRRGRSKTRTVPLTPEAAWWLFEQRCITPRPDSDYIFPNVYGEAMPRTNMRRLFSEAAKASGVDVTPHGLRHSCGSWMLQSGVPPHVVASWLGHTPEVLMRVYAHELEESREDNIQRFADYLKRDSYGTIAQK